MWLVKTFLDVVGKKVDSEMARNMDDGISYLLDVRVMYFVSFQPLGMKIYWYLLLLLPTNSTTLTASQKPQHIRITSQAG